MKRITGILIALVLSVSGFNAFADGAKIGVVDLQKIMQTSSQMKTIQQKLENDFKPRRDKLLAMEEGLKQDMEKFKRDSTVLSDSQKKELEKKIVGIQQNFEREGQQYQQELSTAHNEAMEELYGKIRKAIAKVAATDKYDIVLQKDAAPFSSEKLDITDSVLKQIA
ncbi:MAG: OmpH family outer membrane protein [Tatlockia sp.]|nr:OmpH family outer membrane protein [Tatlockia sp.]